MKPFHLAKTPLKQAGEKAVYLELALPSDLNKLRQPGAADISSVSAIIRTLLPEYSCLSASMSIQGWNISLELIDNQKAFLL